MRSSTLRAGAALVMLVAAASVAPASADDASAPPGQAAETPGPAKPAKRPESAPAIESAKPVELTKPPGTAATVVNMKTIEGVMGKAVRSVPGNEDMGHIVDILVDDAGDVRAAVIDFGGFLGVGSRKVAVAWKTLDFADAIETGSVKVNLTRDQVRQAPEFKADEPIVILEGAAAKPPAPAPTPAPAKVQMPSSPGHIQDSPAH